LVYSNVVYCPNVVVSWRSGVRCEGCCLTESSNIPHTKHIVYTAALRTSNLLQH